MMTLGLGQASNQRADDGLGQPIRRSAAQDTIPQGALARNDQDGAGAVRMRPLDKAVHGDPRELYPWYAGYADETGSGRGAGCNLNLPLAAGTENPGYIAAIETGLAAIERFGAAALIVSLGFDAHLGDPTANLAVTGEGFRAIGERIGCCGLPTLLVQEGGYIVEKLADNLTAFLGGFLPNR